VLHIPFCHHRSFPGASTGVKSDVAINIQSQPLTLIEWDSIVAHRASPPRTEEGQIDLTLQKEQELLGTGWTSPASAVSTALRAVCRRSAIHALNPLLS
tara:strand:- start:108 stop:404 length:297 start_codon:yes stop_codon:yes gene_type:complete